MEVRTQDSASHFIKAIAVFGVSLVYQVQGRNRVVFFWRRTNIGGIAEAKIARSAVASAIAEKSDVDRTRASTITSSIVLPQSFLL
jgi:hypothetical protein